jgi:hypothetical protein
MAAETIGTCLMVPKDFVNGVTLKNQSVSFTIMTSPPFVCNAVQLDPEQSSLVKVGCLDLFDFPFAQYFIFSIALQRLNTGHDVSHFKTNCRCLSFAFFSDHLLLQCPG